MVSDVQWSDRNRRERCYSYLLEPGPEPGTEKEDSEEGWDENEDPKKVVTVSTCYE